MILAGRIKFLKANVMMHNEFSMNSYKAPGDVSKNNSLAPYDQ